MFTVVKQFRLVCVTSALNEIFLGRSDQGERDGRGMLHACER